jgi:hypothetical protein
MKEHDNDNLPILRRHPRLLRQSHEHGCSREQAPKENSSDDESRELAMIDARIKWLNWIEFALMNKRTVANDSQVRPSRTGRESAG